MSYIACKPVARDGRLSVHIMSDLHLGSADTDYDAIRSELEMSVEAGHRVIINGDTFDAIFPGDKRYSPSRVVKSCQGVDEIQNQVVEYAAGFLEPFADIIDMIGMGNHESTSSRRTSFCPTLELVRILQSENPDLQFGGYAGCLTYKTPEGRATIDYHHGAGKGSSPVVALRKLRERTSWSQGSQVYTQGHHHCKLVAQEVVKDNRGKEREVLLVQTGAYQRAYKPRSSTVALRHGREGQYAVDFDMRPTAVGGITVEFEGQGNKYLKARAVV